MAALSKLFGRPKMTYKGVGFQPPISECCVNRELMPRWRSPEVMDDDSQAMGYVCHACGREFLPGDVRNRRLLRGAIIFTPAAEEARAEEPAPEETAAEGSTTGDATDEEQA